MPISALEQDNDQIQDFSNISPGEVFNVPATPVLVVDKNLIICGEQYYLKTRLSWEMAL